MPESKGSVLMLPMGLDIGGAETHVISLAKGIKRLGWQVLVASSGGQRVSELTEYGIPHFHAPLDSRLPHRMLQAYNAVSDILDTYDIDIIHAHARIPIWLSTRLAKKRNIPLVATYHGQFKAGFPWMFFTKPGDRTIAVSNSIKDYIVERFNFNPDNVIVIPNGIDVNLFHPATEEEKSKARNLLNIPADATPVVAYVSRIEDDLTQAAITAQEAAFCLASKYPGTILLIAGDGPGMSAVKARATDINSSCQKELVHCLGFVLDTPSLYAASDIVLGMSRVALESMASERPVIIFGPKGTFGPICPENIIALEERNYVPNLAPFPSTAEVLCDLMEDLLEDPEKMRLAAKLGRQTVLKHHSEDSVAKSTEQVYLDLLKHNK